MSDLSPLLQALGSSIPLDSSQVSALLAAVAGQSMSIKWMLVEYSVEQVALDTDSDDETHGYRLNTARKDASIQYTWSLPDGASAALNAVTQADLNTDGGIWHDLAESHPIMKAYHHLCETYPPSTPPEGWTDQSVGEGYGDYGVLYTVEGNEWTGGYEPLEEEVCFSHRKGSRTTAGVEAPEIWCGPHHLTVEQATKLLRILADAGSHQ